MTTDEATSHSAKPQSAGQAAGYSHLTNPAKYAGQVIGYSHSTWLSKDDSQVAGYPASGESEARGRSQTNESLRELHTRRWLLFSC